MFAFGLSLSQERSHGIKSVPISVPKSYNLIINCAANNIYLIEKSLHMV